jgi:hypothetical protein
MSIKDFIKLSLKLIVSIYFCAVFVYILINVASRNSQIYIDAFSPVKLFNEIVSGNILFIIYIIFGTVFIFKFNYLRKKKVDYKEGGKAWPWFWK